MTERITPSLTVRLRFTSSTTCSGKKKRKKTELGKKRRGDAVGNKKEEVKALRGETTHTHAELSEPRTQSRRWKVLRGHQIPEFISSSGKVVRQKNVYSARQIERLWPLCPACTRERHVRVLCTRLIWQPPCTVLTPVYPMSPGAMPHNPSSQLSLSLVHPSFFLLPRSQSPAITSLRTSFSESRLAYFSVSHSRKHDQLCCLLL